MTHDGSYGASMLNVLWFVFRVLLGSRRARLLVAFLVCDGVRRGVRYMEKPVPSSEVDRLCGDIATLFGGTN